MTLDNKSPRLYVPTGLTDLDRLLDGGLPGAKLTILAAQPGMGAQSFALGMAAHAARCQHPVLYCPLENAAEEICPMLEDRVTGRVNAPIDVDDNIRGVPDLVHAISALRWRTGRRNILVVVDGMAVLDSGNPVREEDKTLESAVINRALAQLARETEATILATLPLRIQVHEDKRPNLPDLRVLGPYEDSADVVIFPYQGSHSYPQSGDHRSAEIIVAKNRSGEFGTVRIHFDRQSGRFSDLT